MDGRLKKQRRGWLTSYLWSAPSLALIALIVVFPILYTFFISLTNMNVYHWFDFTIIGLDNYVKALFVFDSGFLSALINTVLWTVVNMAIQLVLAFVLASLLNIQKLRLRKLYKTLLMFPWAMPGYDSEVIMAAGAFVQGSSIELSADGPIRPPYAVYFQGGLTWYHAKLGILMSLQKLVDAGLVTLDQLEEK